MTKPESFPLAQVPSHLTKLDIDSMPIQTPFYVDVDPEHVWDETPTAFVEKKSGSLNLIGSSEVDTDDEFPSSPIGRIGIMRVLLIDENQRFESQLVADLRYIGDNELAVVDDIDEAPEQQEEFNSWEAYRRDVRPVVAFIAPHPKGKTSKKGVVKSVYYGPEAFHDNLDLLRISGDKLLGGMLKRQKKEAQRLIQKAAPKQAENTEQPATTDKKPVVVKTDS
ncbi:hypothetical protein H7142_03695 [Candidatus Saccharibacteria bacterium]|nr:hypothetical protein [Candidatus Saccharibacteria bacterium]